MAVCLRFSSEKYAIKRVADSQLCRMERYTIMFVFDTGDCSFSIQLIWSTKDTMEHKGHKILYYAGIPIAIGFEYISRGARSGAAAVLYPKLTSRLYVESTAVVFRRVRGVKSNPIAIG